MPERPRSVPEAAWWSADDNEWILGSRDGDGRFFGDVHYWRPDGTLCCICPHVEGKPHGISRRFHENGELSRTAEFKHGVLDGPSVWLDSDEPTTERMRNPDMPDTI